MAALGVVPRNKEDGQPGQQHNKSIAEIPDGVACSEANPLRNGPVLLQLLRELLLDPQGFVSRLHIQRENTEN